MYNDGDSPNVTNESAPGCAEEHLIPHKVLLLCVCALNINKLINLICMMIAKFYKWCNCN